MRVKARARGVRVSPQKVRLILEALRGKSVDEALAILQFLPSPNARKVAKVLSSAVANAENNYQLSSSNLKVLEAFADDGPRLKRVRFKGRGRVNPILKRTSHITVVVGDE